ncbi:hypothetical protein [Vagococcus xieshaowenii]|uniref:Uncharacterized protein n=1 Tax=Vagococcus xieshaowenii TaxID=2562451 RepID=A0AAJ5EEI3_9ENTE|nr:hypothetical protein [Vagococcus xieshaowenii]QCA29449.1 hypothetical protein E4Z98_09015 [Vagococcus xieshaowenii]TFZ39624.1 hypothetical protein E4031_08725 [Vagococcus xieshaowenii]
MSDDILPNTQEEKPVDGPTLTFKQKIEKYDELKSVRSQVAIQTADVWQLHKGLFKATHEAGSDEHCELCQRFHYLFELHHELGNQLDIMKKELGFLKTKEKN